MNALVATYHVKTIYSSNKCDKKKENPVCAATNGTGVHDAHLLLPVLLRSPLRQVGPHTFGKTFSIDIADQTSVPPLRAQRLSSLPLQQQKTQQIKKNETGSWQKPGGDIPLPSPDRLHVADPDAFDVVRWGPTYTLAQPPKKEK